MTNGLHLCKKCGQEQNRRLKPRGGYRYSCGCEEWAKMMAVLARAQKKRHRIR